MSFYEISMAQDMENTINAIIEQDHDRTMEFFSLHKMIGTYTGYTSNGLKIYAKVDEGDDPVRMEINRNEPLPMILMDAYYIEIDGQVMRHVKP